MGFIYSIAVSVVAATLSFIIQRLLKENSKLKIEKKEAMNKKTLALEQGMVCLLRIKLLALHKQHMKDNFISLQDYDIWMQIFQAYADLGGNGMAVHLREDIEELANFR